MTCKLSITFFLLVIFVLSVCESAWANLVIHSQTAVEIELISYNGLTEMPIFKGCLAADSKQEINTPYRGLALLVFVEGQRYPVIIGDESFTLNIVEPGKPPSFTGSIENASFYQSLSSGDPVPEQFRFAYLMIQAKHLLQSSYPIHTVKELTAKKQEFHAFVRVNYNNLKHSDMIKRVIAQYFMMHEYVDYHIKGTPATESINRYQEEILIGVANWLKVLTPYITEQEILNYCVSLYYNRSMVTLANLIIEHFEDSAYCPGDEPETLTFPGELQILQALGNKTINLSTIKGKKLIAFVSEQCPVSMVVTISKARKLADGNQTIPLIVVPTEELSSKHLTMNRMIRKGKLLFVSDEKWRTGNLPQNIKLPLFIQLENDFNYNLLSTVVGSRKRLLAIISNC